MTSREQVAYAYQCGFEDGSRMPEGDDNTAASITAVAIGLGEAYVRHLSGENEPTGGRYARVMPDDVPALKMTYVPPAN